MQSTAAVSSLTKLGLLRLHPHPSARLSQRHGALGTFGSHEPRSFRSGRGWRRPRQRHCSDRQPDGDRSDQPRVSVSRSEPDERTHQFQSELPQGRRSSQRRHCRSGSWRVSFGHDVSTGNATTDVIFDVTGYSRPTWLAPPTTLSPTNRVLGSRNARGSRKRSVHMNRGPSQWPVWRRPRHRHCSDRQP